MIWPNLDDIQLQASEILASKCGKVTGLERLDHRDSCSFDDSNAEYETRCEDLTDLFLKLRGLYLKDLTQLHEVYVQRSKKLCTAFLR